jgi:transposase InsO family protein
MRTFAIVGTRLRRRVRTTIPEPAAAPVPDLFQGDFTAGEPGRKYMGDSTYHPLGDCAQTSKMVMQPAGPSGLLRYQTVRAGASIRTGCA